MEFIIGVVFGVFGCFLYSKWKEMNAKGKNSVDKGSGSGRDNSDKPNDGSDLSVKS